MNMLKKRIGLFPGFNTGFPELLNVNNLFDSSFFGNEFVPAVNIKESEKEYEVEVSAPGLSKEDFQINVDRGMLNISYQKKEENTGKEAGYQYQEFSSRSFQRSFSLPDVVDEDKIGAKYENGILKVVLEKNMDLVNENAKEISIS